MAVDPSVRAVSVVGLGAMGTALARAFLAGGHHVTVWNRTAGRSAPLAGIGAHVAASVAEAADASEVIVVCVLDHAAGAPLTHAPGVASRLKGKTLVQLTTYLPGEAREEGVWAGHHDIAYLDGAIQGYPQNMGTPGGTVVYSGSEQVFQATLPILSCLGDHALLIGDVAGQASALSASLTASYAAGSVLAFLQGAAICEAEGISLDTYLSIVLTYVTPGLVADTLRSCVEMIEKGSYAGSQATLDTWVASLSDKVRYVRESGVDGSYLQGSLRCLERAVAEGHGQDELPAVFECFRKKPT